jgi:hypothetical protein
MAANGNNVRFNLHDENNVKDIVNNGGKHNVSGSNDKVNGEDANNVNEHAAADVQQIPPLMIPEGIDPAFAELLKMQHQNQWMMMQAIMNNQMAQMEK